MYKESYYGSNNNNFMRDSEGLEHAGSYPIRFYVDPKTQELYIKGWDLNDYGNPYMPGTYLLDVIGKPTVVTTGFRHAFIPKDLFHSSHNFLTLNNILDSKFSATEKRNLIQNYVLPYVEKNKHLTIIGNGADKPYMYSYPYEIIVTPNGVSQKSLYLTYGYGPNGTYYTPTNRRELEDDELY